MTQNTELQFRRLMNSITTDTLTLKQQIDSLLEVATTIRRTHANAMLALAQIEHLYVDQSFRSRATDAELYALNEQLKGLTAISARAVATVTAEKGKADSILVQANRITERSLEDDRTEPPVEGAGYVGVGYFADALGVGHQVIRAYVTKGWLPSHDALEPTRGRPKLLWEEENAAVALRRLRQRLEAVKKTPPRAVLEVSSETLTGV